MCSPADDSGWWLRPANVWCLLPEIRLWPGQFRLGLWGKWTRWHIHLATDCFGCKLQRWLLLWKPPTSSTKCPRTPLETGRNARNGGLHDFFRIRYRSSWPESLAPLQILFTQAPKCLWSHINQITSEICITQTWIQSVNPWRLCSVKRKNWNHDDCG